MKVAVVFVSTLKSSVSKNIVGKKLLREMFAKMKNMDVTFSVPIEKPEQIGPIIEKAGRISDVVIVVGGIGNKSGHVTARALSEKLNIPFEVNKELEKLIQAHCKKQKTVITRDMALDALTPKDSEVFPGTTGTIAGYSFEFKSTRFFVIPEDSFELKIMMEKIIFPFLWEVSESSKPDKAVAKTPEPTPIPDIIPTEKQTVPKKQINKVQSKKNRVKKAILNILIVIFAAVFVFAGYKIYEKWNYDRTAKEQYEEVTVKAEVVGGEKTEVGKNIEKMKINFKNLLDINKDTIGYVKVPKTYINYPVVFPKDNSEYLYQAFNGGRYSPHGSVFASSQCEITAEKTSQNIVLYGHNMQDGTMFGTLSKYEDFGFYKSSPLIYFNTLYSEDVWEIFSVFITTINEADDNGKLFNYSRYAFSGDEDFNEYITGVKRRSLYNIPIEIKPTDKILTLSTCANENKYFRDSRFVVVAKKIDEMPYVLSNKEASKNPNPLYPQIWYDKKGGNMPIFNTEIDPTDITSQP